MNTLDGSSAAFDRDCVKFRETSRISWPAVTKNYTVYGCIPPETSIWSYVEELDGTVIASSDFPSPRVNVKDPTVSFSSSSHSVDEGDEATITVELSHKSSELIFIPITVSNGTAESNDYDVDGLSNGELTFSAWDTSATFTIETDDDTDADDEAVNLSFGALPASVSGTSSPSRATVTIEDDDPPPNNAPTFDEGGSAARTVAENMGSGVNIGKPVSATDADGDTLSYSLGVADFTNFSIATTTGQLKTKAALDYETKSGYSITVSVSDGNGGSDSIAVAVTVTNVNEPPVVSGLTSVDYAENGVGIVATYSASDPDGDFVTWTLSGDRLSFAPLAFPHPKRDSPVNLKFRMSSDRMSPDYENPDDSNDDNVYNLTLRARDGNGGSDSINVAVTVTDVNEPPSKPSAPTVSSNGETSLNVAWSAPPNTGPPINDYDVQYRVGNSGPFTNATHTGAATQTTISNLIPDTAYEVQARAKNAEGTSGWSDSGTGTTDVPALTVTIARQNATVTEGQDARFTLTASIAPAAALTVNVSVTDTGTFITGSAPSQATIAAGSATAQLTLVTTDDRVDEANGTIEASILSGTGYSVGSPSSASVTVQDDDQPPAPTGLRANGHLVGGNVTLRWNPVSRATSYNIRYVEEVCNSTSGKCEPDGGAANPNWQTRTNIAPSAGAVMEATLGGLTKEKLYRVEVQAVVVDTSDWSDFTLVFPTDSPLGHGSDVATAPFHGYQAKNAQGSHEFRYVLCIETIPAGLTMTATNMLNAVDEWEDTVTWNRGGGANIIATTAYTLPAGEQCSSSPIPVEEGRFEMKFASKSDMRNASCGSPLPWVDPSPACWRSHSWTLIGVDLIEEGSILLNAERGAAYWNHNLASGCARLHETIVHEVGHAFGIGNKTGIDYNRHPINTTHSTMSYEDSNHYCEPQAYDIIALMALYQSR